MLDAQAVIMALPNPIMLVGQGDRITGVNAPAERLIGTNPVGRHYITVLRQPTVLAAVEGTLRDGGENRARYLSNDGARDTIWEVTVHRVTLSDGLTVVLSFQDMTLREDADAMRRDFVANVSHEMRTPLTSMMGFIETLRGPAKNDPEAQDRFLAIMQQEAGRMHRLVEDLLSLSRVEDQERIRPTDHVVLQSLIHEVIETYAPMIADSGTQVECDLPNDPVVVLGDRSQLGQVIRNLLENAIKYGNEKGRVTICLTEPTPDISLLQDGVQLSVADEGEGIPVHHIARLTERFYRVDSHRSREVGGTGLGLAIVKHIINRHRGRLKVTSELGQGSIFTVALPSAPL